MSDETPNDLIRYGVQWTGPQTPTCVPMEDGYWTPWHKAQARIAVLEEALGDIEANCNGYGDIAGWACNRAAKALRPDSATNGDSAL